MLIDNFDGTGTKALLNSAVSQVGLSATKTTKKWGQIGTMVLDAGFESVEPYASCKMPEIKPVPKKE